MKEGEIWYMQEQKRSFMTPKIVYAEQNEPVTIISDCGNVWIVENIRTQVRFSCKKELVGPQLLDSEGKPLVPVIEEPIEQEPLEPDQPNVQDMSFDDLAKWAKTQSATTSKKKRR